MTTKTNDIRHTNGLRRAFARHLLLLLLLLTAGAGGAWGEATYTYIVGKDITGVPAAGATVTSVPGITMTWGTTNSTVGHVAPTFSYETVSTAPSSAFTTNYVLGGTTWPKTSGVLDPNATNGAPYYGCYLKFTATATGTLTFGLYDGSTSSSVTLMTVDGSANKTVTEHLEGGSDNSYTGSFTYSVATVSGYTYYLYVPEGTEIGLYGFTFTCDRVWDFTDATTYPDGTTYQGNSTSSVNLNGTSCNVGTGVLDGLAFQYLYHASDNKWEIYEGTLYQSRAGRTWGVLNLDRGDIVEVTYSKTAMTLYGSNAEELSNSGTKVVYRMTDAGNLALGIARYGRIAKVQAVKFHFTEASVKMDRDDVYQSVLVNPNQHGGITYATADSRIATVDGSGRITAVAGGKTTVTATSSDGYVATILVDVTIEFGWQNTETVTVSLLDADNNNHVDAFLPEFINVFGHTPTFTPSAIGDAAWFASSGWEAPWGADLYGKPRLLEAGSVDLTVSGTGSDLPSTFRLVVTEPGAATTNFHTDFYEYAGTGMLDKTVAVTSVPGITMEYGNKSDLTLVVNSGGMTVVKMIDVNGFSHPNLTTGTGKIPTGGTYYKFTTTKAGTLIISGVFSTPKLYRRSDETEIVLRGAGNTRSAVLESGKTYYLYNKDSNQPLLHSFRYVDLAKTLTFRIPEPYITIDAEAGTFTNTAYSSAGKPITYSLLQGASGVSVNPENGTVTFSGIYEPTTVVVQATDGTECISYVLDLAKRTWIFNDKDKWTTSSSDLSAGWAKDQSVSSNGNLNIGDQYCMVTTTYDGYTELKKDGTTPLPETKGLHIAIDKSSERMYIAPKGYSSNYLAFRASTIYIPEVEAGQTVTVQWKGYSSSSVLDMADAAGENVTSKGSGTLVLNVTQTGRVRISANSITCYIYSISISSPIQAVGSLNYTRTVLSSNAGDSNHTSSLASSKYTITDVLGATDLTDAYNEPEKYLSSDATVVTVDPVTGSLTAVAAGTAVISATATAKNSITHQASVTLVALVEVVDDGSIRIRTVNVADLLYNVGAGVSASDGLDRRIPGFDLTFTGGTGAKCENAGTITFSETGQMTITPRTLTGNTVTITKAQITVNSITSGAKFTLNGEEYTAAVGATAIDLPASQTSLVLKSATSANFTVSAVKLYYSCDPSGNADNCLDETKVAPAFTFHDAHIVRVPGDGRVLSHVIEPQEGDVWFKNFALTNTYASSAPTVATIGSDGTGGQLIASGASTITATFNATTYFASSSASYNVSNTLLPGEKYDGITVGTDQRIHIEASASAARTDLTVSGLDLDGDATSMTMTYGFNRERRSSYSNTAQGNVTLTNNTADRNITIYSVLVVTPHVRAWLYYTGQEENYKEQVHFKGFDTGPVAGFRIMDVGDPENPVDLTAAYGLSDASYSAVKSDATNFTSSINTSTGNASSANIGTIDDYGYYTISHQLSKNGQADGYDQNYPATAVVRILPFGSITPVVWNFDSGSIADADNTLGRGWSWQDRGSDNFHYGYFPTYSPVLEYDPDDTYGETEVYDKDGSSHAYHTHGILLKDEFRWYITRGLRANLSQVKSSIKFPVKKGMEIDIYAANSSADISHTISNVTDIYGDPTSTLYIAVAGDAAPVHNYFLAAEDGVVELKSTDKVGMYLKSITLRVPKIHFKDEIVTVPNTADFVSNAPTNLPDAVITGNKVRYTIIGAAQFDADGNETALTADHYNDIATVCETTGVVTINSSGNEGWVKIHAENTNGDKTSLEPDEGDYTLYAIDFKFDPATAVLDISSTGEAVYSTLPKGYNKVATAVNYSYELSEGARARLSQYTNANPRLTTYELTAYSSGEGTVTLTAKTGRITTTATLYVIDDGMMFGDIAPVKSASGGSTYTNTLPTSFVKPITFTVDKAGTATCDVIATITDNAATDVTLTGLDGYGALRVTATDVNSKTASFVLTLSYPASTNKKWEFYRYKDGLQLQKGHSHDDKIADYTGTHLNAQTVSDYTITGGTAPDTWTTTTTWNKIYRNGDKEPRWAYSKSVKCDNAFIIEETAGLMIETAPNSFYVDNNSTASYYHVGIHSRATITIPKLKEGDLVSLNLSRVIPNNGAIIEATNVMDLAGTPVTDKFTITRSQIDYQGDGQNKPGYYTFIAHKEGGTVGEEFDVSFTLADQGYLDVLAIEIYSPRSREDDDNGYHTGYDPENGYDYTMLPVKLNTTGYPDAPATLLKENEQQQVYGLSYCHPLWSTSVGPARYVARGRSASGILGQLDATIENIDWYSAGGAAYVDGQITLNKGFGKVTVRMENYTADNKYLIGYTPDYTLTVGVIPHQDYPYTWNFTNISGGESHLKANNAYNGIVGDGVTWNAVGYDMFELNTNTTGGSFYVPGGTFVSENRHLGAKGSREQLTAADEGCDELNGLGITGSVALRTAYQEGDTLDVQTANSDTHLLDYSAATTYPNHNLGNQVVNKEVVPAAMDATVVVTAGNGWCRFGSYAKRQWLYKCTTCGKYMNNYADCHDSNGNFKCSTVTGTQQASTDVNKDGKIDENDIENVLCTGTTVTPAVDASVSWGYQVDGGSTKYMVLRPQRAFRNGDEITITGFWRKANNVEIDGNNYGYSFYATTDESSLGATLRFDATRAEDQLQTFTYTITQGDGLAGRSEIYIYRADRKYSAWITKVDVNTTSVTPIIYGRKLTAVGAVTITVPDLKASPQDWIYVKSSAAPTGITNATAATAADGQDAAEGVWKYKVSNNGNCQLTFAKGTKIERIGVTHILKPITEVGSEGWATESRDRAIDHSLTGLFTKNDVNAYTVSVKSSSTTHATVQLDAVNSDPSDPAVDDDVERNTNVGVPAETGLVLRQNDKTNLTKANSGGVPLFAPAMTTSVLPTEATEFLGSRGNRMMASVDGISDMAETETVEGTEYTRFILAKRFMTWRQKTTQEGTGTASTQLTAPTAFETREAPVFYRLYHFSGTFGGETKAELNALGANKAYLLLQTNALPDALWGKPGSLSRQYVGILGISDMYEQERQAVADDRIYDLRGRVVDADNLRPGVYIRGGRKIVVR